MSLVLIAMVAGLGGGAKPLLDIVETLHSQVRDVSFRFEGPVERRNAERLAVGSLTALVRFRRDTGFYGETWEVVPAGASVPAVERVSKFSVQPHGKFLSSITDGGRTRQSIQFDSWTLINSFPGFGLFWFPGVVDVWRPEQLARATELPAVDLDGRPMRVLQYIGEAAPGYEGLRHLWYLDLERGGNIVRHEKLLNGKKLMDVRDVVLETFEGGGGLKIWFPVRCVVTEYGDVDSVKGWDGSKFVRTRAELSVLRSSIEINRGMSPENAVLKFDPRLPVFDHFKPLPGHVKSEPPRMPLKKGDLPIVPDNLDIVAMKARAQEVKSLDLEAVRAARRAGGSDWLWWFVPLVAAVAFCGGAVYVRLRG